MKPTELLEDGTRSYYLSATDADVKAAPRSSSAPASVDRPFGSEEQRGLDHHLWHTMTARDRLWLRGQY